MVATHAIAPRTGNVSAGTSAFAMVVLEAPLSGPREEIDMVTTPAGDLVAMIHTNNCAGELDAWLGLFGRFAELLGRPLESEELYGLLFGAGAEGDADAGGVLSFNYLSGEHQTAVPSGRPLLVREQEARFTLENFMRSQLYGAFGALAVGMEALLKDEGVQLDVMYAHGGIFRTAGVAQQVLADALATPVAVGEGAGEGGAWGMALLAAFTAQVHRGAGGSGPPTPPTGRARDISLQQLPGRAGLRHPGADDPRARRGRNGRPRAVADRLPHRPAGRAPGRRAARLNPAGAARPSAAPDPTRPRRPHDPRPDRAARARPGGRRRDP